MLTGVAEAERVILGMVQQGGDGKAAKQLE
jgi:hypothetical protein